jgi:hypothetical protein
MATSVRGGGGDPKQKIGPTKSSRRVPLDTDVSYIETSCVPRHRVVVYRTSTAVAPLMSDMESAPPM